MTSPRSGTSGGRGRKRSTTRWQGPAHSPAAPLRYYWTAALSDALLCRRSSSSSSSVALALSTATAASTPCSEGGLRYALLPPPRLPSAAIARLPDRMLRLAPVSYWGRTRTRSSAYIGTRQERTSRGPDPPRPTGNGHRAPASSSSSSSASTRLANHARRSPAAFGQAASFFIAPVKPCLQRQPSRQHPHRLPPFHRRREQTPTATRVPPSAALECIQAAIDSAASAARPST